MQAESLTNKGAMLVSASSAACDMDRKRPADSFYCPAQHNKKSTRSSQKLYLASPMVASKVALRSTRQRSKWWLTTDASIAPRLAMQAMAVQRRRLVLPALQVRSLCQGPCPKSPRQHPCGPVAWLVAAVVPGQSLLLKVLYLRLLPGLLWLNIPSVEHACCTVALSGCNCNAFLVCLDSGHVSHDCGTPASLHPALLQMAAGHHFLLHAYVTDLYIYLEH